MALLKSNYYYQKMVKLCFESNVDLLLKLWRSQWRSGRHHHCQRFAISRWRGVQPAQWTLDSRFRPWELAQEVGQISPPIKWLRSSGHLPRDHQCCYDPHGLPLAHLLQSSRQNASSSLCSGTIFLAALYPHILLALSLAWWSVPKGKSFKEYL